MIISSIDIGTNTVLLLIAQTDPKNKKIIPLLNKYRIPRIGKNLKNTGELSEGSVERLKEVLIYYKQLSKDFKSETIIASATAAFRNAANSSSVINYLYTETGINIRIIPGDTEAQYAYLGVSDGADDDYKRIVIDIGGGSTEIILGRREKLLFRKSYDTGVVFSSELFSNSGNLINDLENYYKSIFAEVKLLRLKPDLAYAIAGTPTTIAAIKLDLREYDDIKVEGTKLTIDDIKDFVSSYSAAPEKFKKFKGILEGREDLMIPGSLILSRVLQNLSLKEAVVSTRGIRHGALIEYLKNQG
jgi:exopolyphosphatase / guanosine-5'-triphosphate,3'-diphosphate pyrophosphatase